MARMPRIKEYRECSLHGRQLHAHTLSRRTATGTAVMAWRCMVCENERSRAAQRRKSAERGGAPRPGGRKPMAPVLDGATRPDSMTLED